MLLVKNTRSVVVSRAHGSGSQLDEVICDIVDGDGRWEMMDEKWR